MVDRMVFLFSSYQYKLLAGDAYRRAGITNIIGLIPFLLTPSGQVIGIGYQNAKLL